MPISIIRTTGTGGINFINTNNSGRVSMEYVPSQISQIITDGLVLRLDAADPNSYPGSGTKWYDLAYTIDDLQQFYLENGPDYISDPIAYFQFNGGNQFVWNDQFILDTNYTKSVWFYKSSYADNNLVSSETGNHYMFFGGSPTLYCGHTTWSGWPYTFGSNFQFGRGVWYNATVTFNIDIGMTIYVNGEYDNFFNGDLTPANGDGTINIATFPQYGGNFLIGRVSKVYCYNRALTSQEVLNNYNADKAYFGL